MTSKKFSTLRARMSPSSQARAANRNGKNVLRERGACRN
jgi:hypothetical protein